MDPAFWTLLHPVMGHVGQSAPLASYHIKNSTSDENAIGLRKAKGSLVVGSDVAAPYEAKMDSEGFAGCE